MTFLVRNDGTLPSFVKEDEIRSSALFLAQLDVGTQDI
jgi:hypothetical protein